MKKIIAFVLLGWLIFTTIACDKSKNNDDTQENDEANNQQIQEQIYGIIEEEIIVGKGTEWELTGILTIPE